MDQAARVGDTPSADTRIRLLAKDNSPAWTVECAIDAVKVWAIRCQNPPCLLLGDIGGFVRTKLGNPGEGDNETCADYQTGTLDGDIAAFVEDLLGGV